MRHRLALAVRALLNQAKPTDFWKLIPLHDDDLYIVSYPKSGNTWLRFLLGNLIFSTIPITFNNVEKMVPDLHLAHNKIINRAPQPRLLKSHDSFNPLMKRVLYLVRDPRDISISYFYHAKKMGLIDNNLSLDKFIDLFIPGKVGKMSGSWSQNVSSWLGARKNSPDFLLLRYEDLLSDTLTQLNRIVDSFLPSINRADLQKTIEMSTFKKMQALEQKEHWDIVEKHSTRDDIRFMRKGQQKQWQQDLTPDQIVKIETAYKTEMMQLGYHEAHRR